MKPGNQLCSLRRPCFQAGWRGAVYILPLREDCWLDAQWWVSINIHWLGYLTQCLVLAKHSLFIINNGCFVYFTNVLDIYLVQRCKLILNSSSIVVYHWIHDCLVLARCGIPMLPKQVGLPKQSFISAEVVEWCYYHVKGVKGVKQAMVMLQVTGLSLCSHSTRVYDNQRQINGVDIIKWIDL